MTLRLVCGLCEKNTLQSVTHLKYCGLQKCGHCGFSEITEVPSEETVKAIYSQMEYFYHNKYQNTETLNKEHKRRLGFVSEFIHHPDANILEVGCAAGDFIKYIDGKYVMWGIDVSDAAIAEAKRKLPEIQDRLHAGFIEKQTYPPNFFDGVVMWDVIEHLRDPFAVLDQLFYHLKPSGHLFLSTPNIGSMTAKVLGKYWPLMTPPEHLSFFTRKSFKFLFEQKLNSKMVKWETKGKWANLGFLFYKIQAVVPHLIPNWLIKLFEMKYTKQLAVYVPTGDIQYVVVQKQK